MSVVLPPDNEKRYEKAFDGFPRHMVERAPADALRAQDAVTNRCSELLGRARGLRAAIRGMLEAKTIEEYAVACSHARIVLELPL